MVHLIVHGFLHLLGYTHEVEKEAQTMESIEIKTLEGLGIDNPYVKGEEL
jgi:probable rRNA maturation factor